MSRSYWFKTGGRRSLGLIGAKVAGGEAKDGERRRYVEYDGEQKVRGLMSARLAEGEGESRKMEVWGEGQTYSTYHLQST